MYKLASSMQLSAGMSTVGLGQPVYIDALSDITLKAEQIAGVTWEISKPEKSAAELVDSPLGREIPIYEPSDRVSFQLVARKLLKPDVAGRYVIKATISNVSAGVETAYLTIDAGTYMGINTCAQCHSIGKSGTTFSMVSAWSKTAHASIFTDGMNGVASDHYGANCLSCHTVGYDAAAANGGFADVAKKMNWTFPTATVKGTYDAVPAALKNLGNIQCENCHGPGSRHVASGGDPRLITVSTDSGVCNQCHDAPTHHIKGTEWLNAGHAAAARDASGAGREGCVGCHTGTGFMDQMNGVTTPRTQYNAIGCQTCHEPHGQTQPATNQHLVRALPKVTLKDGTVIKDAGMGALCMSCHQSRQNAAVYVTTTAGSARFGPHHGPQADMLAGTNGFNYGSKIPSSAHKFVVEDSCVACHMQTVDDTTDPALGKLGGHTFKNSYTDANGNKRDMVGSCQKCHGEGVEDFNFALFDYDDDGFIDGAQTEVQHMLDKLGMMLPPVGVKKTSLTIDSTWSPAQLKAAYNWQFVHDDGSLGIHNMAYAMGLLDASIKDLSKK